MRRFFMKSIDFCEKWLLRYLGAAFALSAALNIYGPETVSEPAGDFIAEHDLNPALASNVRHKNIWVYNRTNPLTPFYAAGHDRWVETSGIFNGSRHADFNHDGKTSLTEKFAGAGLLLTAGLAQDFLFKIPGDALFSLAYHGVDVYAVPGEKNQNCLVRPAGNITTNDMVKVFTGIPGKDIRPLDLPANFAQEFALAHEMAHCDGKDEVGADASAVATLSKKDKGENPGTFIKHIRAVAPLYPAGSESVRDEGPDVLYATAIPLERIEHGGTDDAMSDEIIQANRAVYDAIVARLEETEYPTEGEFRYRTYSVYLALRDILDSGRWDNDPLKKRIAELYIEGVDDLAPSVPFLNDARHVYPATIPGLS